MKLQMAYRQQNRPKPNRMPVLLVLAPLQRVKCPAWASEETLQSAGSCCLPSETALRRISSPVSLLRLNEGQKPCGSQSNYCNMNLKRLCSVCCVQISLSAGHHKRNRLGNSVTDEQAKNFHILHWLGIL